MEYHYTLLQDEPLYAAIVSDGKNIGIINTEGEYIIEPIYKHISNFNLGNASMKKNGKYGAINIQGKEIIKPKYDSVIVGDDPYIKLKKGEKYGFADHSGNKVVPVSFLNVKDYSEDLVAVAKQASGDNIFGYLNREGNYAIPPSFWRAENFINGQALVAIRGEYENMSFEKWGIIDKTGEFIIEPKYAHIGVGYNGELYLTPYKSYPAISSENYLDH